MTAGSAWTCLRRPVRDELAEVEHGDAGRRPTSSGPSGARPRPPCASAASWAIRSPSSGSSCFGQPAGRLVEQQQPRLGDQRAGERDPLAQAVGELVGQLAGLGRRHRPGRARRAPAAAARRSSRSERGRPSSAGQNPARAWRVAPAITFSSTVRPRNRPTPCSVRAMPSAGQPVRRQPGQRRPAEAHVPGVGPDEAAQHVQQGGLAGPVRADDPGDLARARR